MRFLTLSSFSWQSERDNIVIKQKWPENIAMTWNPNSWQSKYGGLREAFKNVLADFAR